MLIQSYESAISPPDPHTNQAIEIYTEFDTPQVPPDCHLIIRSDEDDKNVVREVSVTASEFWLRELVLNNAGRYVIEIRVADKVIASREFFLYEPTDDYVAPVPVKPPWWKRIFWPPAWLGRSS